MCEKEKRNIGNLHGDSRHVVENCTKSEQIPSFLTPRRHVVTPRRRNKAAIRMLTI